MFVFQSRRSGGQKNDQGQQIDLQEVYNQRVRDGFDNIFSRFPSEPRGLVISSIEPEKDKTEKLAQTSQLLIPLGNLALQTRGASSEQLTTAMREYATMKNSDGTVTYDSEKISRMLYLFTLASYNVAVKGAYDPWATTEFKDPTVQRAEMKKYVDALYVVASESLTPIPGTTAPGTQYGESVRDWTDKAKGFIAATRSSGEPRHAGTSDMVPYFSSLRDLQSVNDRISPRPKKTLAQLQSEAEQIRKDGWSEEGASYYPSSQRTTEAASQFSPNKPAMAGAKKRLVRTSERLITIENTSKYVPNYVIIIDQDKAIFFNGSGAAQDANLKAFVEGVTAGYDAQMHKENSGITKAAGQKLWNSLNYAALTEQAFVWNQAYRSSKYGGLSDADANAAMAAELRAALESGDMIKIFGIRDKNDPAKFTTPGLLNTDLAASPLSDLLYTAFDKSEYTLENMALRSEMSYHVLSSAGVTVTNSEYPLALFDACNGLGIGRVFWLASGGAFAFRETTGYANIKDYTFSRKIGIDSTPTLSSTREITTGKTEVYSGGISAKTAWIIPNETMYQLSYEQAGRIGINGKAYGELPAEIRSRAEKSAGKLSYDGMLSATGNVPIIPVQWQASAGVYSESGIAPTYITALGFTKPFKGGPWSDYTFLHVGISGQPAGYYKRGTDGYIGIGFTGKSANLSAGVTINDVLRSSPTYTVSSNFEWMPGKGKDWSIGVGGKYGKSSVNMPSDYRVDLTLNFFGLSKRIVQFDY